MPSLKSFLGAISSMFLACSTMVRADSPPYPDQWESYLGDRAGRPALILYNVGIGGVLDRLPEKTGLIVGFALKQPGPDGLPAPDEGKVFFAMDDAFIAQIAKFKAHDLGRVTTGGRRELYIAAGKNAEEVGRALVEVAATFGYSATAKVSPDALIRIYRNTLSPTPDEENAAADQRVLRELADHGDIADKVRPVDHWAYFPNRQSADAFARWAGKNGFSNVEVEASDPAMGQFVVRSRHHGTMVPADITAFTLLQRRKAAELGGSYDGWETSVMR